MIARMLVVAHSGLSNTDLQVSSVRETDGGFMQRFFHGLASSTGMSTATGVSLEFPAA